MSAKHTPGPWWTTDGGIRDRGGYIAHTNPVQRYQDQDERYAFEVAQREADKRLICTAPNMLAALQVVRMSGAWHYMSEQLQQLIDSVIAKATGGDA